MSVVSWFLKFRIFKFWNFKFWNFKLRVFKFICSLALLFAWQVSVQADQGIKAQLGAESVAFTYKTEAWGQNIGKLDVEGGLLFNNSDDSVAYVSMLVRNESINTPLSFTLGGRLYYADVNNANIGGLALGGSATYHPENWSGLGVGAYYFVVPSITAFLDSDGLTEYGLILAYQLTPTVNIYGGLQSVEVGIENVGDVVVADGSIIGVEVSF